MAVKTITIDMDAYEALRRRKREGQSFSTVIKEHFSGGPTGSVLKRSLVELKLSESTLDAVDCVIEERRKDSPRVPTL
jgi:predicted CopG family antitoxin